MHYDNKIKLKQIASELPIGWSINKEGTIDVIGDVRYEQSNKYMPSPGFGKVSGNFNCGINELTSLAGAPKSVGRDFYCGNNELTSLAGAPKSVGRDFYCNNNELTSLAGAPKSVGRDFYCERNQLTPKAILDLIDVNCKNIYYRDDVDAIINKYIQSKDKLAYQEELLDAGFI